MHHVQTLVCWGLQQTLGVSGEAILSFVQGHFLDPSQTLPRALSRANDHTWRALGVALAGNGFLDQVKLLFRSAEDHAIREQVGRFLEGRSISFEGTPAELRKACLNDLNRALKAGELSLGKPSAQEVARRTAAFQRYNNPQTLIDGATRAVALVAEGLQSNYPHLASLLRRPTPDGPPLLVSLFAYFFRRQVQEDDELAHGLFFDGLQQLSAAQAKSFGQVRLALDGLGERLDQFTGLIDGVIEQLGVVLQKLDDLGTVANQTQAAVLDIHAEVQRLGSLELAGREEFRRLFQEALARLDRIGLRGGELLPQHSFSIRNDDERRAVKQLLARFRQLPEKDRARLPALLNGLGKLQVGAGDFEEARRTFGEVEQAVSSPNEKGEACYNAYRAALEQHKWSESLAALKKAARLDPGRFLPFPMERYEPVRILGAGGFGTAVLCQDTRFDEEVVIKTLHAGDLGRSVTDVFQEAKVLRKLNHPAIIGVRDCEYADPSNRARPYLVLEYFPGDSLESILRERGPLSQEQLLLVARQVASGMKEAHARGVLHRDLKPENILLGQDGGDWRVKVIDFGLALRREAIETSLGSSSEHTILGSSVAGTVKYAPPEQMGELRGVKPGPYSDVYAFGKTCCYALFKTTQPTSRNWSGVHRGLYEVLERCYEHDLEHRYRGFDAVLEGLDKLNRPVAAPPPEPPREPVRGMIDTPGLSPLLRETIGSAAKQRAAVAAAHLGRGEYDQAIHEASEAIRSDPSCLLAWFNRGEAARMKGDYDRAIADASEVIRLDPSYTLAYGTRSNAYRGKGNADRAIADATEAIRLDPRYVLAWFSRADGYRMKGDYDRAIADATEAIRLDIRYALAYGTRADANRMKGDHDRAISDATEAIRLDPRYALAYGTRSNAYRMKGDLDRGIADANEAIRLDPRSVLAWFSRAEAHRGKGDLDRAIADATEVIRLDPRYAAAYGTRGCAFRLKGDFASAVADLSEAMRLDPSYAWGKTQLELARQGIR